MRLKCGKLLLNLGQRHPGDDRHGRPEGGRRSYKQARAEAKACFAAAGLDYATGEEDKARRGDLMRVRADRRQDRGGGSTWQSLARGGAVEADYLNGEIVLLGRLHGVPTPVNELLQRAANAAARDKRPPESVPIEELLAPLGSFDRRIEPCQLTQIRRVGVRRAGRRACARGGRCAWWR